LDEVALILEVVRQHPGILKKDVGRLAGLSSKTLPIFVVNRLVAAGALSQSRGGFLRLP
jgi:hypothetical protein